MRHSRVVAVSVGVVVVGTLLGQVPSAAADPDAVQVGTYAYLSQPDYDGIAPARTAAQGMTLGLGTFDDLDGELVLVGGQLMRVSTDGVPKPVTDGRTTPFLTAVRFHANASGPVAPGTTCANLGEAVTALAGSSAGLVAVRVRGTFTDLVTRSVAAQPHPNPPLAEAIASQVVFPLGQRKAVLVGFWTGSHFQGIGAPGLHLHGVTADRTAGGHVLSCVAGPDVQLSIQQVTSIPVTDH